MLTNIFTLVSTGLSPHTSPDVVPAADSFSSSCATRCLRTLCYKDSLQRQRLLYTDSQTPPSAHLRCRPLIVRPFLDPSGPSGPQRWNKCSRRTWSSAECGLIIPCKQHWHSLKFTGSHDHSTGHDLNIWLTQNVILFPRSNTFLLPLLLHLLSPWRPRHTPSVWRRWPYGEERRNKHWNLSCCGPSISAEGDEGNEDSVK